MNSNNFGSNPWHIKNDEGRELTPSYIKAYIQSYCRGEAYSYNRQQNIAYFSSGLFLNHYMHARISDVCKAVRQDSRWNSVSKINKPVASVQVVSTPTTVLPPAPKYVPPALPSNYSGMTTTQFVKALSTRILIDYGVNSAVVFGSGRLSYAQIRTIQGHTRLSIHFGSQSITRAFTRGFDEYKSVAWVISGLDRQGMCGVRLLVLHEVAHAIDFVKNGLRQGEKHGAKYQKIYAELISKYWNA